jgi:hypothetical protein
VPGCNTLLEHVDDSFSDDFVDFILHGVILLALY